jgi:hypothetical protein
MILDAFGLMPDDCVEPAAKPLAGPWWRLLARKIAELSARIL